jgi:hypothetical protein
MRTAPANCISSQPLSVSTLGIPHTNVFCYLQIRLKLRPELSPKVVSLVKQLASSGRKCNACKFYRHESVPQVQWLALPCFVRGCKEVHLIKGFLVRVDKQGQHMCHARSAPLRTPQLYCLEPLVGDTPLHEHLASCNK